MCQIFDGTKTKVYEVEPNTPKTVDFLRKKTVDFLSLDNTLRLNKGPTNLFTVKSSFGYFS